MALPTLIQPHPTVSDSNPAILHTACGLAFDPSYGFSLAQLLSIPTAPEPADFDSFWQTRYQQCLATPSQAQLFALPQAPESTIWQTLVLRFQSCDQRSLGGWLLLPRQHPIKRGFIIGHGYGGRDAPDYHLPFSDAALFFPCARGFALSAQPDLPHQAAEHVLHQLTQRNDYILGLCVSDLWQAVSALLTLFPHLQEHLGYMGLSFGGGIGAMALGFETRISRAHLNVPSFGQHRLRLRLATLGSGHYVQQAFQQQKKTILNVLRYHDAASAAKRIRIPMHCACALLDPAVAPPGQFAIYNALSGPKQLFVLPAGHQPYPEQVQTEQALQRELNAFFAPLSA